MFERAPKLELDWEEHVFRGLLSLWKRFRPDTGPTVRPEAAVLADDTAALTVFARTLAAEPVRLVPARGDGGLRAGDLLVPPALDLGGTAEENRQALIVRIAVGATIRRLGLDAEVPADPGARAAASLDAARRATDALIADLPGFEPLHRLVAARELATRPAGSSAWDALRAAALDLDTPWPAHAAPSEGAGGGVEPVKNSPHRRRGRSPASKNHVPGPPPGPPQRGPHRGDPGRRAPGTDPVVGSVFSTGSLLVPPGDPGPALRMWGDLVRSTGAGTDLAGDGDTATAPSTGSERKGKPVDEVERVTLNEDEAKEKVVAHSFEKIETLDEHKGQVQRMDGADELDEHMEALDEIDMRQVIRGGERAQSLYRAEVGIDANVPDVGDVRPGEQGVTYDEWDASKGRYKPNWCTVYPTPMGPGDARWAAAALPRQRALVEDLHRRLVIHRTRRSPVRGQRDGEELDLDALVDDFADRRAGRGPSDRLYVRKLRRQRSFATTVLLDISLSTDAWVADRRVLDVAREAVLVLGEVAQRLGDPLQVLAFASHTRNRCRVWNVRDWQDPWELGRARLGALRPQGYTRIGPALRHAFAELGRADADRRLLLLVSDGKPTDYDRYEGRYGVADVRQALREAEARGISTHGLAVDAVARDHLPSMLGPGAWHILPDPRRLPEALTTVYGRLTGR